MTGTTGKRKSKNRTALAAAMLILFSALFLPAKTLTYKTKAGWHDETPVSISIPLKYHEQDGTFVATCEFAKIKEFRFNPEHKRKIILYGLSESKDKDVVLTIKLKRILEKTNFIHGIKSLEISIQGKTPFSFGLADILNRKDIELDIRRKKITIRLKAKKAEESKAGQAQDESPFKIEIANYPQAKDFLKDGHIVCYSKEDKPIKKLELNEIRDSQLTVPPGTVKIQFKDSLLEGKKFPIDSKTKTVTLEMVSKSFTPVDKCSTEPLDKVIFIFYIKKDEKKLLERGGILPEGEQKINFTYPAKCEQVYLKLIRSEYRDWEEDITASQFVSQPKDNVVGMWKKIPEIVFKIKNGKQAVVTIGNQSETVKEDEEVTFKIDPNVDKRYRIAKKCFKPIEKDIEPGQCKYEQTLEPVNVIEIVNRHNYEGTIEIVDNLNNNYEVEISENSKKIPICGERIASAQLKPDFVNKTKFNISIDETTGNRCQIIAGWDKIDFVFDITLKTCGEPRPETIDVYVDEAIKEDGEVGRVLLSIPVKGSTGHFQHTEALKIPYSQDNVSAFIINNRQKIIPIVETDRVFNLMVDLCRPALAVVVFLTNTRMGLINQHIIDREVRRVFNLSPYYKNLYIGWVSYNRTNYFLNDFEKDGPQQILIPDINTHDTTDLTLYKIIRDIQQKFAFVNVSPEGEKLTPDKLRIIMDETTISSASKILKGVGYSPGKIAIKFIDINDVVNNPENLIRLIEED